MLTETDKSGLYSDAFMRNAKQMLGESAFATADLKTHYDVAQMEIGVLKDEVTALTAVNEKLKAQIDQGQVPATNADLQAAQADQATA